MFPIYFAVLLLSTITCIGAVPQRLRPQCRSNVCDDRPECPKTSCSCLFASRMDCAIYYQCVNGKPYQYKCSPGLLFNAETLTCDYSYNVNCPSEVTNTTSSMFSTQTEMSTKTTLVTTETFTTMETTKSPTTTLSTTEITTTEVPTTTEITTTEVPTTTESTTNPPTTTTPEVTTKVTEEITTAKKTEAISTIDSSPEIQTESTPRIPTSDFSCPSRFGLFPDPQNCFRFYHCSHWTPYHKWCPSGLHFNPKLKVCDWPYRAGCDTYLPTTPFEPVESPTTQNPNDTYGTCDCDCCELPVPNDCTAYVLCINKIAFTMRCSPGLYFNPMTGTCDYRENVVCAEDEITCPEPSGRYLLPDSCSYFMECHDGTKTIRKCPEGLQFNQSSEMCTWLGSCSGEEPAPTGSKVITDNTVCDGCDYCFKPLVTDCSRYIKCHQNIAIEEHCGTGLFFNPVTEMCDHDYNVVCPEPQPQPMCSQMFGYFPYPGECGMYFQCINGTVIERKCPGILHFNPVQKHCDYPWAAGCDSDSISTPEPISDVVDCDCDCCLKPVGTDCRSFMLCISKVGFVRSCSSGLRFNPQTENCDFAENVDCPIIPDIPGYQCPEYQGLFPHPEDCHKFIHCAHGFPYIKDCPSNLHFNPTLKVCDWPYSAGCQGFPTIEPPIDHKDVSCDVCDSCFIPDETDCASYIFCRNGTGHKLRCTENLSFNPDIEACDLSSNVRCPNQPTSQCSKPDGLFPAKDCSQFIHCSNGIAYLKDCPDGLEFNPQLLVCDWPENVKCGEIPVLPTPPAEDDNDEPKDTCNCDCCFLPYDNDCSKYILCLDGYMHVGQCSRGLLFNPSIQNCDMAERVNCGEISPLCPEPNGLFPNSDQCSSYLKCSNGVSVVEYCQNGTHFSVEREQCLDPCKAKCDSSYDCSNTGNVTPIPETFICLKPYGFYAAPNDCTSFYVCSNGLPQRVKCPYGLHYNVKYEVCEEPCDAGCDQSLDCVSPDTSPKTTPPTTISTPSDQCLQGDGLYPDEDDCSSFYQCSRGRAYHKICPSGLHFSLRHQVCEYPCEAKCNSSIDCDTTTPKSISTPSPYCPTPEGIYPIVSDCSAFYLCSNGKEYVIQCPPGLHYSEKDKVCENPCVAQCDASIGEPTSNDSTKVSSADLHIETSRDCETTTPEAISTPSQHCPRGDGQYPVLSDCTAFYLCSNGQEYLIQCPPGLHYSEKHNVCENPCVAQCDSSIDCETTTPRSISTPSPHCPAGDGQYPVSGDCTAFYLCSNDIEYLIECPTGLHYSDRHGVCENPCDAKCDSSADCGTTTPKAVSTPSAHCPGGDGQYPVIDDCTAFYLCSNGKEYLIQCPSGLHYSERLGVCERPCVAQCDTSADCDTTTPKAISTLSPHCPTGDGLYPALHDCTAFYLCSNGKEYLIHCPTGLHFSKQHDVCEDPCVAQCDSSINCDTTTPEVISTPSPNCPTAGLYPAIGDCSAFYLCSNNKEYLIHCPAGLHFSKQHEACEDPCIALCNSSIVCDTTTPKTISTPSPNCPTAEGLYPVTGDCGAFYLCSNGKEYLIHCPPGLHYSENHEACENPCVAQCNSSAECEASTKPVSSTTPHPTSPECEEPDGLFPNIDDCGSFYQCSNSRSHLMQCPNGLHFSPDDAACERPCVAGCDISIDCPPEIPDTRGNCTCDGCYLPDPSDCSAFYFCDNGRLAKSYCPFGTLFSKTSSVCEDETIVDCEANGDPSMCPERFGFFPYPGDCKKFVHCDNGVAHIKECKGDLEYDPMSRVCTKPKGYCGDIILDPNCPEPTGMFPDPIDCSLFYHCEHGVAYPKKCSAPLMFNPDKGVCDWPDNVACGKITTEASTTPEHSNINVSSSSPTPTEPTPSLPECYEVPGVVCPCACRVPTYDECSSYFQCLDDGTACKKFCPEGLYFNKIEMVCDLPENVECRDFFFTSIRRAKLFSHSLHLQSTDSQ